jgi:hypothetical protein
VKFGVMQGQKYLRHTLRGLVRIDVRTTTIGGKPMSVAVLEQAAIGRPINRLGASIFPVYLPGKGLPFHFVSGAASGIVVGEKPDAEVPTLQVTNPNGHAVLIPEGQVLDGGHQTRTVNVSILVPAGATIDIPVSCVEAGRWGGGNSFTNSDRFANRRVRRAKMEGVRENLRYGDNKRSDQGAVWNAVDFELNRKGIHSPSANFRDIEDFAQRDQASARAIEDLVRRGPLAGQQGVVVAHGQRIVNAELFATHEALCANWEALMRGIVLDAPGDQKLRTSATAALKFLSRLSKAEIISKPGVGLGTEEHVRSTRLVGHSLSFEGALVHASAFALAA